MPLQIEKASSEITFAKTENQKLDIVELKKESLQLKQDVLTRLDSKPS